MDWLLKMPYPDGSGRVSHKLTRTNFSAFIMPEEDNEKRFFTEWSSAATASFAAVAAKTSRIFAHMIVNMQQNAYLQQLSFNFLIENPDEKPFIQGDFILEVIKLVIMTTNYGQQLNFRKLLVKSNT